MKKVLSSGVIILDVEASSIFIGHATDCNHWSVPKGVVDYGEFPIETAIRETKEETGINIKQHDLIDLGRYSYLKTKDLHLFLYKTKKEKIDPNECICTTYFTTKTGIKKPEIDDYKWVDIKELYKYVNFEMLTAIKLGMLLG